MSAVHAPNRRAVLVRRSVALFATIASLALGQREVARAADVEVEARVTRRTFAVGETSSLDVTVRGGSGGIQEPDLGVPPGLELLGSGRTQSFSWINGRSTSETVFRFEIGANRAGRYALGPIRVKVGAQYYESPAVDLTVTAAATRVGEGGGGPGPASLLVDVTPAEPYVGQPVLLRVRLVQRTALAEDPQYTPPPTPGFWSERFRDPESYYADEGNRRVLVTETRARLYPLGAGRLTIGEASALLALPTGIGSMPDPMRWLGGGIPRREVAVRSTPREVRVRPLPPGAPAGFDGAVGELEASWSADRPRTSQDVPFTVRLDVRGSGNLPLIRTPPFDAHDLEIFPASVEDSLGSAGELGIGRRSFQWTVLPQRSGRLDVRAPAFAWFDPRRGVYVAGDLPPVAIEVGPALFAGDEGRESFPAAFTANEVDPGAHRTDPWGWALAGLLMGAGIALVRGSGSAPEDAPERAAQREWLRSVGLARGRDFWQAADGAAVWLASRGAPVAALRRDIDAARYGGAGASDPSALRPRIVEQLGRALPPPPSRWPQRIAAVVLVVLGLATALFLGPRPGDDAASVEARRGDVLARGGDVEGARSVWRGLWSRGHRAPGLAARLGWAAIRSGEVGQAAAWTLRGEREESRDPSVLWVRERVREGGGLVGAGAARLRVRRIEWAILALALGVAAGGLWPRRAPAVTLAVLCLLAGLGREIETRWIERSPRAVVLTAVPLEGSDLQLEPGQVVALVGSDGARVRIRAARDLIGTVPADAIEPVSEARANTR